MSTAGGVLLLCYGNPGRMDDGLGPAFAEALEPMAPPGVTIDVDYQLSVEQAAAVAEHEHIVFVDAAARRREPFSFVAVLPGSEMSFSTHSVEPGDVLAMAARFFGARPQGYALAIRGYEFNEFGECLSARATDNLTAALRFLVPVLEQRSFAQMATSLSTALDGETEW